MSGVTVRVTGGVSVGLMVEVRVGVRVVVRVGLRLRLRLRLLYDDGRIEGVWVCYMMMGGLKAYGYAI